MRAAIFNPYLDTLGGGERYTLGVASTLQEAGYDVYLEWENIEIKSKLENRFGLDLSGINFIPDVGRGNGYDVCFWVSDGSVPVLHARKNFLHFQIPFHNVKGNSLINKMKLIRINKIICNSLFTKKFIDKEYGVNSQVIYPPVDLAKLKPKRKENKILFVGRFSQLKQAKNQDVLIRAFRKFYDKGSIDWELVLAGGIEVGVGDYISKLEKMVQGYPIKLATSPSFKELVLLYGEAKIFWSAVGFGASEEKEPEKMEHFGISVVEAMAAGCVPIIFNGGGYKEIVKNGESGFLWDKESELIRRTELLVNDRRALREMSSKGKKISESFGYERFAKDFRSLL